MVKRRRNSRTVSIDACGPFARGSKRDRAAAGQALPPNISDLWSRFFPVPGSQWAGNSSLTLWAIGECLCGATTQQRRQFRRVLLCSGGVFHDGHLVGFVASLSGWSSDCDGRTSRRPANRAGSRPESRGKILATRRHVVPHCLWRLLFADCFRLRHRVDDSRRRRSAAFGFPNSYFTRPSGLAIWPLVHQRSLLATSGSS